MRILYVEDRDDFSEEFAGLVRSKFAGTEINSARSYEHAVRSLSAGDYDLVILDLAIPREDEGVPRVEIGSELARLIGQEFSGTQVLIFTGQLDESETDELLYDMRRQVRYMGGVERPYLSVWRKDRLERLLSILETRISEESAASGIILSNLANGALGVECPHVDRKILKGFCKFRDGARGRVRRLGGLSGSAVYRLDVLAADGSTQQRSVAKIDSGSSIDGELRNYNNLVTRLPGGYPPAISVDLIAGGSRRAAFYNLAEGFDTELFDLENHPANFVQTIRQKFSNWHGNRVTKTLLVHQIVEEVAGVVGYQKVVELDIPGLLEVLASRVDCFRSIQHGDLHGANVLCKADGSDVCIIDFGDVGEFVSTLDVVTLELSFFFHPSSSGQVDVALKSLAPHWFDDDKLRMDGYPGWLLDLRRWARESALSHLEYAAAVLAYSSRQLKYENTDHALARTLIEAAVQQLRDV